MFDLSALISEDTIGDALRDSKQTCQAELRHWEHEHDEMIKQLAIAFIEVEVIKAMGGTPNMEAHSAKVNELAKKAGEYSRKISQTQFRLTALDKAEDKIDSIMDAMNEFQFP